MAREMMQRETPNIEVLEPPSGPPSAPGFKTGSSLEGLQVPMSKSSRVGVGTVNPAMTAGDEAAYFDIMQRSPGLTPEDIITELLKRRSAASQSYRALGGRPE